ncbi:DUF2218 domain-containing protein [Phaeobacter sp.]|uniref:DUF2218 domain-containing protein n=1 Tax=Phaeobacter sp. TaxID=1902409 RepID=UPI0025D1A095|nr:DUF2218 domain-containing protein [Phaeobacter sp.]
MQAKAKFYSAGAQGYFAKMVRHFSHKIPVTEGDGCVRLEFSCGLAELRVSEEILRMLITAGTPEQLVETCDVIERHLLRFAFREAPMPLEWQSLPKHD